jgi:hypothetical protein
MSVPDTPAPDRVFLGVCRCDPECSQIAFSDRHPLSQDDYHCPLTDWGAYVREEAAHKRIAELEASLRKLVSAQALNGVRGLVAGWNGENLPEPHRERHPSKLGATLPKTNCGAVYELDEAMQEARAALALRVSDGASPTSRFVTMTVDFSWFVAGAKAAIEAMQHYLKSIDPQIATNASVEQKQ